jgi:hypothetical protein
MYLHQRWKEVAAVKPGVVVLAVRVGVGRGAGQNLKESLVMRLLSKKKGMHLRQQSQPLQNLTLLPRLHRHRNRRMVGPSLL